MDSKSLLGSNEQNTREVSCSQIWDKEILYHVLCIYVIIPFIFQESIFQLVLVSGKNMSFALMHYGHIAPPPYAVEVK